MGIAAMLVIGLTDGQGRAERAARWIARKLSLNEDKFAAVLRQVGERMEELVSDRVAAAQGRVLGDAQLAVRRGVAVDVPARLR